MATGVQGRIPDDLFQVQAVSRTLAVDRRTTRVLHLEHGASGPDAVARVDAVLRACAAASGP